MIFKEISFFKFRNKKFLTRCINKNDINDKYIKALSTKKFVRFNKKNKKTNYLKQSGYINEINKSKNKLLAGFFNKKKLIGTVGVQKISSRKYYIGILIFDFKFKGIGLSKVMLSIVGKILKKNLDVSFLYATVNKNNLKSHRLFKSLGFKKHKSHPKRYKSDVVYYINTENLKKFLLKNQLFKILKND